MSSPLRENQRNRYRSMREFALGASTVQTTPASLQIARTNRCNFKCAYCIDHRVGSTIPRTELVGDTWSDLRRLIPASTSMAFHGISEFLIDPEFFAIVADCAAHGVELSINTNGSVCTEKHVDAFVHYPSRLFFNFSIDAATEPTYRRIRAWDWARLLRNIETYVAAFARRPAPTKTTLSYVIFASNLHETAAVVRLAHRLGVDGVKFYRLHEYAGLDWVVPTTHGGDWDYHREHTSRCPDEYDAAIDAAEATARELGVAIELPARYRTTGTP
ncbi:MAG: radical SAM protein [Planctomycetes bacterium]|nr:radical SAM protein [Planctomycetota bacterium]